ncbi:hypothetical protein Tco_1429210 [Tanacetum coccineum]
MDGIRIRGRNVIHISSTNFGYGSILLSNRRNANEPRVVAYGRGWLWNQRGCATVTKHSRGSQRGLRFFKGWEILKGHPIFKALTLSEDVPEIYVQQFWNTIAYNTTVPPHKFEGMIEDVHVAFTLKQFRRSLIFTAKKEYDDFSPKIDESADADLIMILRKQSEVSQNSATKEDAMNSTKSVSATLEKLSARLLAL